ncbi:flippase [Cryomorphaceae bacterium]|nr:flippase [Cryomorphaceae bacterium]
MLEKVMRKWGYVQKDANLMQLLTSSGLVLFFKVSGALAGYLFTYLVSNYYGARIYGIYELCYTAIMIAGVVGRLGLDGALVRFMAEFKSKEQFGTLRRVYRKSMTASGLLSLALGAGLYLLAPWLAERLGTETEWLTSAFRWTALIIPPFVMLGMNTEALRGLKRMTDFAALQHGSIILLAALGVWLLYGQAPDHLVPVLGYGGGVVLLLAVSVGLVRWRIHQVGSVSAPGPGVPFRSVLNVALPILLSTSMFLVISWTDTLMIGYFLDETNVGIYRVAFKIATLITFAQFAINSIAAPMFSEFFAQDNLDGIRKTTRQIGLLNLGVSTPIFLIIIAVPGFLLGLFGEEFAPAVWSLIVLAAGQLVNALCGPVLYILNMTGKERVAQRIMIITSVLNVGLNLWLIPAYGYLGAAVATSFSMMLWNILAVIYIKRTYGFITFPILDRWID